MPLDLAQKRPFILMDADLNTYSMLIESPVIVAEINLNLEIQLSPYRWVEAGEA